MSWSIILKKKKYTDPITHPVDEAVTALAKALADDHIERILEETKNRIPEPPKSSKYDYQYSDYDEETKDEIAQQEKDQEIALKEIVYDDFVINIERKIFDNFEEIFKEGWIDDDDDMGSSGGVLVLTQALIDNDAEIRRRNLEW